VTTYRVSMNETFYATTMPDGATDEDGRPIVGLVTHRPPVVEARPAPRAALAAPTPQEAPVPRVLDPAHLTAQDVRALLTVALAAGKLAPDDVDDFVVLLSSPETAPEAVEALREAPATTTTLRMAVTAGTSPQGPLPAATASGLETVALRGVHPLARGLIAAEPDRGRAWSLAQQYSGDLGHEQARIDAAEGGPLHEEARRLADAQAQAEVAAMSDDQVLERTVGDDDDPFYARREASQPFNGGRAAQYPGAQRMFGQPGTPGRPSRDDLPPRVADVRGG